jgi:hypothetical protein
MILVVCDAMDQDEKTFLFGSLQILMLQTNGDSVRNARARALQLSLLKDYLCTNESSTEEHATNVANFVTMLGCLSAKAIGEILAMTEPHPTTVIMQAGIGHDQYEHESQDVSTLTPE